MLQPWEVYDQDLFDLEMVRVFARSWVWLGDTEDLAEPGDFITGRIGMQPVIVIRQTDGSVKGFLNNCRHRASGLEFEPSGHCGRTLTCPYHNWAYSIDGTLVRSEEHTSELQSLMRISYAVFCLKKKKKHKNHTSKNEN